MFDNVRKWWKTNKARRSVPKPRPRTVLRLERLEDRTVPSFLVTNLNDTGAGSLRAAITAANAAGGNQGIAFQTARGTITLETALPDLTANIDIDGGGTGPVYTVKRDPAKNAFRIFTVDAGSTSTISGLEVTGGWANLGASTDGGGVWNGGTLTLSYDYIDNNKATGANIGAEIFNAKSATLNVQSCEIFSNTADDVGGGIYNAGTLDVYGSNIINSNNAYDGGGIYNENGASAGISDYTEITANSALSHGAGVYNAGSFNMNAGTISNNTITGTLAPAGGGLYEAGTGTATLTGVTIQDNSAGTGQGGGFYLASGSNLTLNSCTVQYNTAATGNGGYVQNGATYSHPNSVITDQVVTGP